MLRPHAIIVYQVVLPCYSLGKKLSSPRVSLITLDDILWFFHGSLGFFLMSSMCYQGISPIH